MARPEPPDDDLSVTLRIPRGAVALVLALATHALLSWIAATLPVPKKREERVEFTLARASPPPSAAPTPAPPPTPTAPPPAPTRPRPRRAPDVTAPVTTPVAPVLPPQDTPSETRAVLPVAEVAPDPTPPPAPSSWKDRLLTQLDETTPRSAMFMKGPLAPSSLALDKVVANDPRMHDEENERRLQVDHGPFFRRGLEALRSNWHPGEVLAVTERDPTRRCGRLTRITFAIAVLDRKGNVVDVELRNPSGCPDLDDEAIAAFKRVAVFPHPPEGIFVLPDGTPTDTARYPVRFIVTFDGGLRLDWRG